MGQAIVGKVVHTVETHTHTHVAHIPTAAIAKQDRQREREEENSGQGHFPGVFFFFLRRWGRDLPSRLSLLNGQARSHPSPNELEVRKKRVPILIVFLVLCCCCFLLLSGGFHLLWFLI